jgi:hypothetical protein
MNKDVVSLSRSAFAAATIAAAGMIPLDAKAWWSYDDATHTCGCGCGETWFYRLWYPDPEDTGPAYNETIGCEDTTGGCGRLS